VSWPPFARFATEMGNRLCKPNLFLVGAPRSGTTALYLYLRSHPEVAVGLYKEPHFFAPDLQDPDFFRDEGAYLELYSHATTELYVLDGSVWYLYSETAAERIHQFDPAARIVMLLRNPADMVLSIHAHHVYTGYQELEDFSAAYHSVGRNVTASFREELPYRRIARYGEQLSRYLDKFDADQIHVSLYEDLKRDPAGVYGGLMRFLGLQPGNPPDFRTHNAQRRVRSRRLARLHWYVQRKNAAAPSPSNALVSAVHRARHAGLRVLRFINTAPTRPSIDPAMRREIIADYRCDILKLSDLIGRDLSHWLE